MISLLRIHIVVTSSILITACTSIAMPTQYEHSALATHNKMRKMHGAPAMQWDDDLAHYAAQHASHCVFRHSHGSYGENIAEGYPSTTAAIQAWYDEKTHYDYQRPGFSMSTGHFTQLVWKSSTRLGCASAVCHGINGTPGTFFVCEYSPPGNITNKGYFERNVLP